MTFNTIKVLHMNFINATFVDFIKQLEADLKNKETKFIVTANPEIVLYANKHQDYMDLVNSSDYTTPDGIGIVNAANTLGTPIPERITGYDVMMELLNVANKKKYKIYMLGAKEQINEAATGVVLGNFSNAEVVGNHDGYFDDDEAMQAEIAEAKPDIVFAALGFPKQEFFLKELEAKLESPAILMGVGGSFDVLSGLKKRAPKFFIDFHIEWLYRLLKEPTRARRMLAIPEFMMKVRQSKKPRN